MKYTIELNTARSNEIKRILYELIDDSRQHLEQYDQDMDDAVHEIRKNMKKARAILRLIRYAIAGQSYDQLNKAFRNIARQFASAREANVYLETINDLKKNGTLPACVKDIEKILHAQYADRTERRQDQSEIIESTQKKLGSLKTQIERLKLQKEGIDLFYDGLKRIYKQGRNGLSKAKDKPDAEHLHEWRKRVKYLWYHLRLLKPIWPKVMKGMAKSLDRLSDDLGKEHDLFDLKHFLSKSQTLSVDSQPDIDALIEKIDKKRNELQLGIWPLGEKLYVEKPKRFARRIASYWEIAYG